MIADFNDILYYYISLKIVNTMMPNIENIKIGDINIEEIDDIFYIGAYFPKYKTSKDAFSDLIIKYKKCDFYAICFFNRLLSNIIYNYFRFCDLILPIPPSTSMFDNYSNKIICISLNSLNIISFKDNILIRQKNIRPSHLTNNRTSEDIKQSVAVSNCNFIKNKNIILFDDIITSGITSKTIKNMLLENGANSVYRLFIAKTVDSSYIATKDAQPLKVCDLQ